MTLANNSTSADGHWWVIRKQKVLTCGYQYLWSEAIFEFMPPKWKISLRNYVRTLISALCENHKARNNILLLLQDHFTVVGKSSQKIYWSVEIRLCLPTSFLLHVPQMHPKRPLTAWNKQSSSSIQPAPSRAPNRPMLNTTTSSGSLHISHISEFDR